MQDQARRYADVERRIRASLRAPLLVEPGCMVGEVRERLTASDAPDAVVVVDHGYRVVDALTVLRSELDDQDSALLLRCCEPQELEVTDDLSALVATALERPPAHRTHDLVIATDVGPRLLAMSVVLALIAETCASVHQVDVLTGLPGRATINAFLEDSLRRDPDHVAVAFVDLDRFKEVNDLHGHAVGDRVLQLIGQRLRRSVRDGDLVGRMGGDEFVAVLHVSSADEARTAAERLVARVREPMEHTTSIVSVGVSVGISLAADTPDLDARRLVADADALMYLAKQRGGGVLVAGDLDDVVVTRSQLEDAIAEGALRLQYQPIVPLDGSPSTAVEALARWPQPDGSVLQPCAFIPLAEATGQIVELDWWALHTAIRQLHAWDASDVEGLPRDVNVNLSALTLSVPGLVSHVERVLAIAGVAPERLTLELTETAVVADTDRALDVLTSLHALGVRTAIDDFGVGQSSLSQLSRLPVSALKIDRAFVSRMTTREVDRSVIRVVRALADELDLEVVAEGVESLDQADALRELGVTHAQGWLWAPAVDAATVPDELGALHGRLPPLLPPPMGIVPGPGRPTPPPPPPPPRHLGPRRGTARRLPDHPVAPPSGSP